MADHHEAFTHAYVYYIDTRERDIVSLDCVKNFQLESYNQNKKYTILWNSKEYEGTVVFLGESFEAVEARADRERPRIPTSSLLLSNSSESESDAKQSGSKVVHNTSEKLQLQLSAKLNSLTERNKKRKAVDNRDEKHEKPPPKSSRKPSDLNKETEISLKRNGTPQGSGSRNVDADLEKENEALTPKSSRKASDSNKENQISLKRNGTPQGSGSRNYQVDADLEKENEALTPKSSRKASDSNKENQISLKRNGTPQGSGSRIYQADADLEKENEALTPKSSRKASDSNKENQISLKRNGTPQGSGSRNDCCINIKKKYGQLLQQHTLLTEKNEGLEAMLRDSQILNVELQKKVITGMGTVQETLERLINRPMAVAHNEQLEYPPVAFKRLSDNQVHIGRDMWISSQVYDSILISSRSASLFVKNMAVAVFGIEMLKKSTVKGKVSNRMKKQGAIPRPPLDHSKVLAIEDIFRHWLEEKQRLPSTEINYLASLVPTYIAKKISQLNATPKPKLTVNYQRSQILQNDEGTFDFDSSEITNVTEENDLNDNYEDDESDETDVNKSSKSSDADDYESD